MSETLLQYGALGVMVIGLSSITWILWQENKRQAAQYIELLRMFLDQQKEVDRTLNKLSDGMAAQDLIRQYIERQQNVKKDN
jgi:hypothetical protein